jgi:hypothetical protein
LARVSRTCGEPDRGVVEHDFREALVRVAALLIEWLKSVTRMIATPIMIPRLFMIAPGLAAMPVVLLGCSPASLPSAFSSEA